MPEHLLIHPSTMSLVTHVVLVVAVSVRVIMQRPATGVALAWLVLIAAVPLGGAALYLLVGERRISRSRARGLEALRIDFADVANAIVSEGLTRVDWSTHPPAVHGMHRLGLEMVGSPTVHGSDFQLRCDTHEILRAMARDIDAAQKSVLMEFYIWNEGGVADEVLEAVIRAARRGVACCLLIAARGARPCWQCGQPSLLRAAGVAVRRALPVGLFRALVGRTDLRLHRKVVVIDGQCAWTGSMNLVDPAFFKQDAGVGQWVDAMVRVQGSAVIPLAATWLSDWILETGESFESLARHFDLQMVKPHGVADVQVVPSGPGETGDGLLQMVLTLVHSARQELVLTTPYLVPDESLLRALRGAAARGVHVQLIVPRHVDSLLTRHASRSYFDDLLEAGVTIYQYNGGLLHTKSITADGQTSMFGTANLDMRSFWLNYEVSLFVYDHEFTVELRKLQQSYADDSTRLDSITWASRPLRQRFLENTLRLVSPLL